MKVKNLVLMAMYIALFVVFDVFSNMINILQMPNGGSVSLSVIPLLIASYHLGVKNGLIVGCGSVLLMFITGPMYTTNILSFILDYFVAFAVYGLASGFKNIKHFYVGVLVVNFIRFLSSTIAGVVCWEVPLWGSITYNATYMIPTTIMCLIVVPLLMLSLKPVLKVK